MSDAPAASPSKKVSQKTKKAAAPKKPADHPKYIDMITTAVGALKERTGSSRQAIAKYVKANYKVTEKMDVHLKLALKRGTASGALRQVKGTGASGSFKLPEKVVAKKTKKPAAKRPSTPSKGKKKKIAKKASSTKKVAPAKKPAAAASAKKVAVAKKPAAKKAVAAKKPAAAAKKPVAAKKPPAKKPVAKKPAAKKVKKTPKKKIAAKK